MQSVFDHGAATGNISMPGADHSSIEITRLNRLEAWRWPCKMNRSQTKRCRMEWVLFVSLQWIVYNSPTNPTTQQIDGFASEELCKKAADAIKTEINAPIGNQRG